MRVQVYGRPKALTSIPFTYCPACGHGIVHRLTAEVIDELGIGERTTAVWPVGCSVFGDIFFNIDSVLASHGKAPAVATGLVRGLQLNHPDVVAFTHQGDGDLASIGMGEIIHAANRGENFTVLFINNTVYGMTSGQMAPTTLLGQSTTTSPAGRNVEEHGNPIGMCELLAALKTPVFIARVALTDVRHIRQAKKAIERAFKLQIQGKGFTFVEILSPCPTNWRKTPQESIHWMAEEMVKTFPLGIFRKPQDEREQGGGADA